MTPRTATLTRTTGETEVSVAVVLDGTGRAAIGTGIGFLDHLLSTLTRHSRLDLTLTCRGDLVVDDHHTSEDCALALGAGIDAALGERRGFGARRRRYAPLDEALARAVVDLSGRACAVVDLGLHRDVIGTLATENITHFIVSLASTLRATIHVDVLRGQNDHHRAEAAFKALALALRIALGRSPDAGVPSTKGVLNSPGVVVVDAGSANLASVVAAFERLGARSRVSGDAAVVRESPIVVLPGVGAFGPAMRRLRDSRLNGAVLERVRLERPLLAICLGMQLLCGGSAESPGVEGLGVAAGLLHRFDPPARVPQMGWNRVTPGPGAKLVKPAAMYFANSYRLEHTPEGWAGSTSDYGGVFVSAFERGPILACQFHPELSGAAGIELIGRWLSLARVSEGAPC